MGISLADQTMDFLLALAFGAGLGAFYDVFRILRALIPTGKIVIFFQDLLYWCICGVLTFLFILGVNAGEIRRVPDRGGAFGSDGVLRHHRAADYAFGAGHQPGYPVRAALCPGQDFEADFPSFPETWEKNTKSHEKGRKKFEKTFEIIKIPLETYRYFVI